MSLLDFLPLIWKRPESTPIQDELIQHLSFEDWICLRVAKNLTDIQVKVAICDAYHMITHLKGVNPGTIRAYYEIKAYGSEGAFYKAIEYDDVPIFRTLLQNGFLFDSIQHMSLIAIKNADRILSEIISEIEDVNYRSFPTARTYLMWACHHKNRNMVETLLLAGADPNLMGEDDDGNYHSPLDLAFPDLDILKLLLEYGADPNCNTTGNNAAIAACEVGNREILELLVQKGFRLSSYGYILMSCVDYPDLVRFLLEKGMDPNSSPTARLPNALSLAIANNNTQSIELLFPVTTNFDRPLYYACENKNLDLIKRCLAAGANPNSNDLLNKCKREQYLEGVQALLEAGAH